MRLIAIAAVLALTASPALACGPNSPTTASGDKLKHIKKAEPSEAVMRAQGFVKAYTRCGSGSYVWVKKDPVPTKKPTS
jgi:hypothetical protein